MACPIGLFPRLTLFFLTVILVMIASSLVMFFEDIFEFEFLESILTGYYLAVTLLLVPAVSLWTDLLLLRALAVAG